MLANRKTERAKKAERQHRKLRNLTKASGSARRRKKTGNRKRKRFISFLNRRPLVVRQEYSTYGYVRQDKISTTRKNISKLRPSTRYRKTQSPRSLTSTQHNCAPIREPKQHIMGGTVDLTNRGQTGTAKEGSVEVKRENLRKVDDGYEHALQNKPDWDDELFTSEQLYSHDDDTRAEPDQQEQEQEASTEDKEKTPLSAIDETMNDEEKYTPVWTSGKVRWDFFLTSTTNDEEIAQTLTSKLLLAAENIEKKLGIKPQKDGVSMGPRERARQARDTLKNAETRPQSGGPLSGTHHHLTRNVALEVNTTVVQSPGVRVTADEQKMANDGLLEYTLQVELNLLGVCSPGDYF